MGEIRVYTDELLFSNKFLERLQNPTDPAIDKCSTALLQLFIDKYAHRKEELLNLTEKSVAEANKFLTQELTDEDLGFLRGRHPARTFSQTEKYLEWIHSTPYIVFETLEDGKICYEKLPLIKDHKVVGDKHKVIFNDMLIYHISPDKQFGRCSLSVLKAIKKKSIVAGILYEVGCRWQFAYNGGKGPFFDYTEKQLREKLTFDKMQFADAMTEDKPVKMTEYKPVKIKCMRIDNIRRLVLEPALEVLKQFFDKGDIDFYLEMSTFLVAAKKEGRPPKKNFRFKIIKKDILSSKSSQKEPVQQQLFDDYEEINNLTEIETELKQVIKSTDLINRIIRQIKDKEVEDNNFSEVVLTKLRNIRTKYAKKGTMEWGKVLLQVLADDFSLGDLKMSTPKDYAKKISWPDTIGEKIKLMQNSWEICDKAIRDYPHLSLNQEKVISILGNEFKAFCMNSNPPKPLRNWKDATDLFFTMLGKTWFTKKINCENGNNGNNETAAESDCSSSEEAMLRFYGFSGSKK